MAMAVTLAMSVLALALLLVLAVESGFDASPYALWVWVEDRKRSVWMWVRTQKRTRIRRGLDLIACAFGASLCDPRLGVENEVVVEQELS
jgi:hypothetical protein